MAKTALLTLCEALLDGLDRPARAQLTAEANTTFELWKAQNVAVKPKSSLRLRQTVHGQAFSSDADLILPFVQLGSAWFPSLAGQPRAYIAAALLLELPQQRLADESALTAMLADEIKLQEVDRVLQRQAARAAPFREQAQRLDEARRRGGAALKGIPQLGTYLRDQLARNPEATAKELWRGIEDAKEVRIEDAQIWIEDDQLWVDRNGRRKPIKFPSFERYVTLARKKKSQ